MNLRKICTAGVYLIVCSGIIGISAMAFWKVTGRTVNILSMSAYRAEIIEEYEIPAPVSPGVSVSKTVNVRNSGTADMIVRVCLEKQFGTRGEDGKLIPDETLDPEMILLDCNETYWKYLDGFWYYTEVLMAGSTTREPLLRGYRVSEQAGNAYKGKDAEIVVTMDSVQAEGEAISLWGIRSEDLGIRYRTEYDASVTSVVFAGQEEGFAFHGDETDLFAAFKNLLPGCSRTQEITVKNTSKEETELFLSAEAAQQNRMTKRQLELVQKLLGEYAVMEIYEGERLLYAGPVNGKPESSDAPLGQPVSLGLFQPSEQKALNVRLMISPDMEREAQALTGKVQWVFTAQGSDAGPGTGTGIYTPKTGDSAPVLQYCLILTGSVCLFFVIRKQRKRRNFQ